MNIQLKLIWELYFRLIMHASGRMEAEFRNNRSRSFPVPGIQSLIWNLSTKLHFLRKKCNKVTNGDLTLDFADGITIIQYFTDAQVPADGWKYVFMRYAMECTLGM